MKKIFIFLLTLIGFFSSSQNSYFEGSVVEKDNKKPIVGAKIVIEEIYMTSKTDQSGNFKFDKEIPEGDYVVAISREGYKVLRFVIYPKKNKRISKNNIEMELTDEEAKKRKKIRKDEAKKIKEAEKKAEKEKKERDELKRKCEKKLKKGLKPIECVKPEPKTEVVEEIITETQRKYAQILGVDPVLLTNKELYNFIDSWIGKPYKWGGETEEGIDCSAFTQRLYSRAKRMYIERTAIKQYESKDSDIFLDKKYLKEGDLVFFKGVGPGKEDEITHVGVYLHNNKFVHATSSKATEGVSGVKISDLSDEYWSDKFDSCGRRINQQ